MSERKIDIVSAEQNVIAHSDAVELQLTIAFADRNQA